VLKDSDTGQLLHRFIYFFGENSFMVSYREKYEDGNGQDQILQNAVKDYISVNKDWHVLKQTRLSDGSYQIESEGRLSGSPCVCTPDYTCTAFAFITSQA
jgi:hypothetical protein